MSPPSELQEIPVAIREQSGVLCFPAGREGKSIEREEIDGPVNAFPLEKTAPAPLVEKKGVESFCACRRSSVFTVGGAERIMGEGVDVGCGFGCAA